MKKLLSLSILMLCAAQISAAELKLENNVVLDKGRYDAVARTGMGFSGNDKLVATAGDYRIVLQKSLLGRTPETPVEGFNLKRSIEIPEDGTYSVKTGAFATRGMGPSIRIGSVHGKDISLVKSDAKIIS